MVPLHFASHGNVRHFFETYFFGHLGEPDVKGPPLSASSEATLRFSAVVPMIRRRFLRWNRYGTLGQIRNIYLCVVQLVSAVSLNMLAY